jgi:hypothetical protein
MKLLKKHGLSLVLVTIFLLQSIDFFFVGHDNWVEQERVYATILHEQPQTSYSDYLSEYRAEMMVSMLADTYGAVLLVLLTKNLREKGSEESK